MTLWGYLTGRKKHLNNRHFPNCQLKGIQDEQIQIDRKCNYHKTSYSSDSRYILVCNILTISIFFLFFSFYTIFLFLIDCERPNICLENNSIFCYWELFFKSGSHILVHSSSLVTLVSSSDKMNGGLLTPLEIAQEILSSPQGYQQLFVALAPFMISSKKAF